MVSVKDLPLVTAGQIETVPTVASLPTTGILVGAVRYALDTNSIYTWNGVSWDNDGGAGTVTSVSVVSANGLAGTVANAMSTPAITLSTTVTGLLQGNGTAISAATTGDLTDTGTDGIIVTGGTGAVLGSGTSLAQHVSDTTHNGYLSSTDWNTFNSKQAALTFGDLTDAGTDGITITGGTGAVVGSGTSIAQHVADTTHSGYLSSTDWNTFNGKGAGTVTSVDVSGGTTGITASGGPVTGSGTITLAGTLAKANGGTGISSTATFPASGIVVTEAASETLSNKTLGNTNSATLKSTSFVLQDNADTTKQLTYDLSAISTGTVRTLTVPNATTTIVGTDTTQTLTNKTISGGSNTITNVSLTTGVTGALPPANGGTGVNNNAASTLAISGSFGTTLTVTGATTLTLPTTGTLATLAGAETLTNKAVKDSSFKIQRAADIFGNLLFDVSALSSNQTATYPNVSGTIVYEGNATTLAAKTMSGLDNTFTNISLTSAVTGVLPPANGGTGVANNAASTLTVSGNFGTTLTVSNTTALTLPTTGTLATLAGTETFTNKTVGIANGTVGAPSLNFTADADGTGTGIYRVAADSLGFAANGVNVAQYSSAGAWTVGVPHTNNYDSGSAFHTINGALVIGGTGSADESKFTVISCNAYNSSFGGLPRTTGTGGVGIVLDNRTSDTAGCLSFITNLAADGATAPITTVGILTQAGAWTLGATSSTANHSINGTQLTLQSTTDSTIVLNSSASTRPILKFDQNSVLSAFLGASAGASAHLITGDASGDLAIASNSHAINFSGDAGTTNHGSMSSAGAWLLGPASGGVVSRNSGTWLMGLTSTAADVGGTNIMQTSDTGGTTTHWVLHKSGTTAVSHKIATSTYQIINSTLGVSLASGGTSWGSLSDIRQKKNIRPLEYGLKQLAEIDVIRFDYLSDVVDSSARLGFSAQNLLTCVPEAVLGSEDTEYSITPTDLIPVLVKAVQDLKAEFDAYKAGHP